MDEEESLVADNESVQDAGSGGLKITLKLKSSSGNKMKRKSGVSSLNVLLRSLLQMALRDKKRGYEFRMPPTRLMLPVAIWAIEHPLRSWMR